MQRLVGDSLSELREEAKLSVQAVADRIEVSTSTIQRIERGAFLPKEPVLRRLLELYGPDSARAAIILARWHQAKTRGWWAAFSDLLADDAFIAFEQTATTIRTWQPFIVPGLLQTEDYARAMINAMFPGSKDNVRRVELRIGRRIRFNERTPAPQLHVILDEAVIRRPVGGPEIMRDQLGYLKKIAGRPNITLQIIPFTAGEHVGMLGPRVLLGHEGEHPNVVLVETPAGDLYPEDERSLRRFDDEWEHLRKAARSPEESVEMLADLLKE